VIFEKKVCFYCFNTFALPLSHIFFFLLLNLIFFFFFLPSHQKSFFFLLSFFSREISDQRVSISGNSLNKKVIFM
jgi:hypothetical protein